MATLQPPYQLELDLPMPGRGEAPRREAPWPEEMMEVKPFVRRQTLHRPLRTASPASLALRAAGVALPPTVHDAAASRKLVSYTAVQEQFNPADMTLSVGSLHTRCVWAVLVVLGSAAQAAEVGTCNDLDRISNLIGQTKSYSAGKIKIAHVDTNGEPVCCSSHLLVFIPDPEIGRQCFAVSQKAAKGSESPLGFNSVEFNRIKASYDRHHGLLLNVPYTLYRTDGGRKPGSANVRMDLRGKGFVRIE
jgi:hypothetical protein